ncbi:hypothetical protein B0T20DRAFT_1593 [Sordaria brevicollis]|uniref:Uncharacterized protein n=1 Tax=Sordaria brevicollis TaxID=83679 RepID=A0AAE0UG30_SORBR|nr:hypothetical protein B0T20DRAFT_1593 [Sordaria brevicollis]
MRAATLSPPEPGEQVRNPVARPSMPMPMFTRAIMAMGHANFSHRGVIEVPMTLVQARLSRSRTHLLLPIVPFRCAIYTDLPMAPTPCSTLVRQKPYQKPYITTKWCGEERVPKWKSLVLEYLPALLAFSDWLSRRGCGRVWIWWDSWNREMLPNVPTSNSTFHWGPSLIKAKACVSFSTLESFLGSRQREKGQLERYTSSFGIDFLSPPTLLSRGNPAMRVRQGFIRQR